MIIYILLNHYFCKIWHKKCNHVQSSIIKSIQNTREPVSLTFLSALRKLNTEPSIGASHQMSAHFGKAVSEMIFRNRPI